MNSIKKKSLNIIGCGIVGKTLAILFKQHSVFEIQCIVNQSLESATNAVHIIGEGQAVTSIDQLAPADIYMIATGDSQIEEVLQSLNKTGLLRTDNIIFHCSGALSSTQITDIIGKQFACASIHPVKSFADLEGSVSTFSGTYVGMEGDPRAIESLRAAFKDIGAQTFNIKSENKIIYHAATVVLCNYLTALLDVGLQCYQLAGVERLLAQEIIKPIVTGTIENIFRLGLTDALTGPIARGDVELVQRQSEAMYEVNQQFGEIYRLLGSVAVELSNKKGIATRDAIDQLRELFLKNPAISAKC